MLLHDLLDDPELRDHVVEVRGDTDIDLGSIVHDSRQVTPGALFCCIPGAHSDGHDHAPEALRSGAAALLVERMLAVDATQARVDSVRRVLGPLCARFHGHPSRSMKVVGVTGTNGKTSITYLLEAIARANNDRAGVIGTIEARIDGAVVPLQHTTPEATDLQALLARMRAQGVDTVAMEVSSHSLDQHRVDGTRFAAVTFTNLTHEHLDYHLSVEAYFEAKAMLFDPRFSARAAINIDDPHGVALCERARARGLQVRTYAIDDSSADVCARDLLLRRDETLFDLVDVRGEHHGVVHSPLIGRFNVANALAAAATALEVGFSFEAVLAGLSAPVRVPGRFERVATIRDAVVVVDYAHTPDALTSVLDAARTLVDGGRLIVVFGCGGDRDRTKRPLMGEVATRLADAAILTSDNPRSEAPGAIAADVLAGVPGRPKRPGRRARPARRDPGGRARRGSGRRRRDRGKGPRDRADRRRCDHAVRRPHRRRRRAGVVLVTRLTARDIAARTGGARRRRRVRAGHRRSAFDSRTLGAGACFVALRGDRDGHDFVAAAFDAGASVALVERGYTGPPELGPGRALVRVDDTLRALQNLARTMRRDRADLHVVAVAGSSGKTSTKDLLAAALASRGCHANAESFNNEFGLPITLCNTPESARVVVAEMGERFAGDLEALCDIARPDTGVVTNVGPRPRRAPRWSRRCRRRPCGARRRAPRGRDRGAERRRPRDPAPRRGRARRSRHRRRVRRRRLPGHRGLARRPAPAVVRARRPTLPCAPARPPPRVERRDGDRGRQRRVLVAARRARDRARDRAARPRSHGAARERPRASRW